MLDFDSKASIGPLRYDISVTSACNYNCIFCGAHSPLLAEKVKPVFMSNSMLENIFKDLRKIRTKEILFAGNGEPLLHLSLPYYIEKYGQDFKIELVTNGSLLQRIDVKTFKHITNLTVSLNAGMPSSHQITHGYKGDNDFNHIIGEVERLLHYRTAKNHIDLNYVITTDNEKELPAFNDLCNRLGVQSHIRPVDPVIPGLEQKRVTELAPKKLPACYIGYVQGFISANGDVLNCCGALFPLGNLNAKRLDIIWTQAHETRWRGMRMDITGIPLYPACYGCVNAQLPMFQQFNKYYRLIGGGK